jgi:hypothetical protein
LHHTGPKRALSNIICDVDNIICDVDDIICDVDDIICDVDNIICDVDKYFVTKFFDVYEELYAGILVHISYKFEGVKYFVT